MTRLLPAVVAVVLSAATDTFAQTSIRQPSVHLRRESGLHLSVLPADVNKDGILDLVANDGTEGPSSVVLRLGRADGTFAAARVVAIAGGEPLAIADFNNDGNLDLLTRAMPAPDEAILLFAGNGDGTFRQGNAVWSYFETARIATADFDGDGNLDFVISGDGDPTTGVTVLAGHGDLTFGDAAGIGVHIPTGNGANGIATGDVTGDGRADIVVTNSEDETVSVLANRGGFLFARVDLAGTGGTPSGVALADLDRDSDLDLIVTESSPARAVVRLNAGNGTFPTLPRLFDLPSTLADRVALGDVNRDGFLDLVAATSSRVFVNDCAPGFKGIATVSVLPGRGDGLFALGSTFAVGDQANPGGLVGFVGSLQLADVSRDGHLDIVVGGGDVLVTTAPDANWAPTVTLGADATLTTNRVMLSARVTDVDRDAVSFAWQHSGGRTLPAVANPCIDNLGPGTHTFTVHVTDHQGHFVSDSVTYTVPGAPFPANRFHSDVGAVQAAGGATFDGTTFVVKGSGADIWGTADEFHWAQTSRVDDFDITARVGSVDNINAWTKAGLMIRDGVGPGARHASLFVTPAKGIAFQRRLVADGISTHTAGPALTAPVWLKLTRRGATVSAYYRRTAGDAWTLVGRQTFTSFASSRVFAGLAVSSHVDGLLASATFTDVAVEAAREAAWSSADIGATAIAGRTAVDGPNVTMEGSGADIWNGADAFRFRWTDGTGFMITARVRTIENTDPWAKAGVMMREDLAAGARHVMVIVSPRKGVAMQFRGTRDGATANVALRPGAAPEWVRLVREANAFTGYVSEDGVTWTRLGSITLAIEHLTLDGLVVTSHATGTLATATFDEVRTNVRTP